MSARCNSCDRCSLHLYDGNYLKLMPILWRITKVESHVHILFSNLPSRLFAGFCDKLPCMMGSIAYLIERVPLSDLDCSLLNSCWSCPMGHHHPPSPDLQHAQLRKISKRHDPTSDVYLLPSTPLVFSTSTRVLTWQQRWSIPGGKACKIRRY